MLNKFKAGLSANSGFFYLNSLPSPCILRFFLWQSICWI